MKPIMDAKKEEAPWSGKLERRHLVGQRERIVVDRRHLVGQSVRMVVTIQCGLLARVRSM
ncbi:DJ-1/PfpI family protein [Sesbania bispinosa]|nr:DJ-1/PfpI family protein [Sesbania bispinosa]